MENKTGIHWEHWEGQLEKTAAAAQNMLLLSWWADMLIWEGKLCR